MTLKIEFDPQILADYYASLSQPVGISVNWDDFETIFYFGEYAESLGKIELPPSSEYGISFNVVGNQQLKQFVQMDLVI